MSLLARTFPQTGYSRDGRRLLKFSLVIAFIVAMAWHHSSWRGLAPITFGLVFLGHLVTKRRNYSWGELIWSLVFAIIVALTVLWPVLWAGHFVRSLFFAIF